MKTRRIVRGMLTGLGVMAMVTAVFGQTNLTVVRHADNTIWVLACTGTSSCAAPYQIPGGFSVQPTVTWDPALNKYILIGIGNNGSNVWRSTFNADGTWNSDWTNLTALTGPSPSPVAVSGGGFKGFPNRGVAIVAPTGGNYTDPVTAMANLSAWCPSPSFSNPCLLKLMPGQYNIGSNNLVMIPYVDLEGSGENVTTITGNYGNGNGAVVVGASNSEMRFLTAVNTGGGSYAIAIANLANSPKITHVTATAVLGTNTWGIYNWNASPTIADVTVTAGGTGGGADTSGVHNHNAAPRMTNVTVSAVGSATHNYGVFNEAGSAPIIDHMRIDANGGSNYNVAVWSNNSNVSIGNSSAVVSGGTSAVGFYNDNASRPAIFNMSISASGASSYNSAVWNQNTSTAWLKDSYGTASGGAYAIAFYNTGSAGSQSGVRSQILGTELTASAGTIQSYSLRNDSDWTVQIASSQIDNGIFILGSLPTCVFCFNASYATLDSNCL